MRRWQVLTENFGYTEGGSIIINDLTTITSTTGKLKGSRNSLLLRDFLQSEDIDAMPFTS